MDIDRSSRLEALFARHGQAVRAYTLRRIDRATADDVVSEVFVIAFRRLDDVPADALPWLLGTARRVLANHRRSAGRREALATDLRVLHAGVWHDETSSAPELLAALASLSEGDRELLMLVAWDGLDPAASAAVLGCSRATFAVRLHRARRRLALAMARTGRENAVALTPSEVTK